MSPTEFEEEFGTFDPIIAKMQVPDVSSGDGIERTDIQCLAWAETIGCEVVKARDNQLFIDIDSEIRFKQFLQFESYLRKHFSVGEVEIHASKQGLPHRHVTVNFRDDMPILARIALQCVMGSDPMRDMLSVKRALNQEDNIILFFEKREEDGNTKNNTQSM